LITFCNGSKGNQQPFGKLQEGMRLPHANALLFSLIFLILHAVANPFWQVAKRNLISFRAKTKGGK
jgi:hypothetical protein